MTNPFSDGHKNLVRIFIHTKPVEAANKKPENRAEDKQTPSHLNWVTRHTVETAAAVSGIDLAPYSAQ